MTDIGNLIRGELIKCGVTETRAQKALGLSPRSWARRLADPGSFKASEIRRLRKLLPDEVCDKITK